MTKKIQFSGFMFPQCRDIVVVSRHSVECVECCAGSYCIFKRGECPNHFSVGSIYWDDAAPFLGRTSQTSSGMYCILLIVLFD